MTQIDLWRVFLNVLASKNYTPYYMLVLDDEDNVLVVELEPSQEEVDIIVKVDAKPGKFEGTFSILDDDGDDRVKERFGFDGKTLEITWLD